MDPPPVEAEVAATCAFGPLASPFLILIFFFFDPFTREVEAPFVPPFAVVDAVAEGVCNAPPPVVNMDPRVDAGATPEEEDEDVPFVVVDVTEVLPAVPDRAVLELPSSEPNVNLVTPVDDPEDREVLPLTLLPCAPPPPTTLVVIVESPDPVDLTPRRETFVELAELPSTTTAGPRFLDFLNNFFRFTFPVFFFPCPTEEEIVASTPISA